MSGMGKAKVQTVTVTKRTAAAKAAIAALSTGADPTTAGLLVDAERDGDGDWADVPFTGGAEADRAAALEEKGRLDRVAALEEKKRRGAEADL